MNILCAGKLFYVMLAAVASVSPRAHAASISTVYDMDRMLSELHPMANEYGTRWTQPPSQGLAAPLPEPLSLVPQTVAPIPSSSSLPLAPLPQLPPSMSPPPIAAASAPSPAAAPKPVVSPVPISVAPKLELLPRLSIDTSGLDVDVVKTAPPPPPPDFPAPVK
ncbi:MAG: hypothetical protein HQ494_04205 [Rhodospirillales bacterium]|nr:hypothetical protein [Rhodospirillales bacterium]